MWKNFVSKKIFLILAAILLLTLAALSYLKVAYGYEFEDVLDQNEGWFENVENDSVDDGDGWFVDGNAVDENEKIFDGEIMGTVVMSHKFLDGDILKISVHARDMVMPILGLAFHLNYGGEKIKFLKYEPGEFLEIGGDPFYLVQNDEQKNKIIFGETLRRNDDFPVGGGLVADFYFQIFKKNAMDFEFANGVVSTLDVVRQDIDEIVWENLNLDKNGRKIVKEIENDFGDRGLNDGIEVNTEANGLELPENFIMILMAMIIVGLGIWLAKEKLKAKKSARQF